MGVAELEHQANERSLATIHYRHHPFFGEEVEIVRRFRRHAGDSVIVKVRQHAAELAVPVWMLDPAVCGQLREGGDPRLIVSALLALRELLDSQPILHRPVKATSRGASQGGGGYDAPEDVGQHSAAHAAIRTS